METPWTMEKYRIFFPKPRSRENAGWLGGTRIGAGRPADVACGLEIGVVGRHATRIGAGGMHNGGACIGTGPDWWNLGIAGARHRK